MDAARIVAIWEAGVGMTPDQRLRLLSDSSDGALTVGSANARIFKLRRELFGPRLTCVAVCPHCSERLEAVVAIDDLLAQHREAVADEVHLVDIDGAPIRFRLVTLAHLDALGDDLPEDAAETAVIGRCLVDPAVPVTGAVGARLDDAMHALDPLGRSVMSFQCSACNGSFEQDFDIATFLWSEIEAWSERMLAEVHLIASTYGWREADIFSMSTLRRQVYLDLIAQ